MAYWELIVFSRASQWVSGPFPPMHTLSLALIRNRSLLIVSRRVTAIRPQGPAAFESVSKDIFTVTIPLVVSSSAYPRTQLLGLSEWTTAQKLLANTLFDH